MRVFVRTACVEENEIACLEVPVGDFTAGCRHIAGGSRQADAEGVFIDELNHAAAIKTGGSSAAAPFVRRPDKAHAVQHQLLRTLGVVDIADADGVGLFGQKRGGWPSDGVCPMRNRMRQEKGLRQRSGCFEIWIS